MRAEPIAAALLALVFADALGAGASLSSRYLWRQELREPPPTGTLFRVAVPDEVFDGCDAFPEDLRIVGSDDRPWPFYLWIRPDRTEFERLDALVLNRGVAEGDEPRRVLELRLREAGRPRHNRVRIETEGRGFIRRVEVRGSKNRRDWLKLGEGWLIDHVGPTRVRNTEIRYPDSDLPFLELTIGPNAREASDAATVSKIEVGRFTREAGDWEAVESVATANPPAERASPDAQTHYFDLPARNRPLERLVFDISDREFARPIQIHARNAPDLPWRLVHDGAIHRLGDDERVEVTVHGFADRHLKVEIFHYDDEPLELVAVTGRALSRHLVVESRGDAPVALFYGGGPIDEPPRFDLRARKGPEQAVAAATVELGPREPNGAYRESAPQRMLPWITGSAIALVSLILVWVIAGMLRRRPASPN